MLDVSRPLCSSERADPPPGSWVGGATSSQRYGGHGERETPGPIPNPEAKPPSADGTAPETGWESRTPPDKHSRRGPSTAGAPSTSSRGLPRRTAEPARAVECEQRPPIRARKRECLAAVSRWLPITNGIVRRLTWAHLGRGA